MKWIGEFDTDPQVRAAQWRKASCSDSATTVAIKQLLCPANGYSIHCEGWTVSSWAIPNC